MSVCCTTRNRTSCFSALPCQNRKGQFLAFELLGRMRFLVHGFHRDICCYIQKLKLTRFFLPDRHLVKFSLCRPSSALQPILSPHPFLPGENEIFIKKKDLMVHQRFTFLFICRQVVIHFCLQSMQTRCVLLTLLSRRDDVGMR